jgi:hypothetical protein
MKHTVVMTLDGMMTIGSGIRVILRLLYQQFEKRSVDITGDSDL